MSSVQRPGQWNKEVDPPSGFDAIASQNLSGMWIALRTDVSCSTEVDSERRLPVGFQRVDSRQPPFYNVRTAGHPGLQ